MRERKAAATRLALAAALERRLNVTPLSEILVDEIAAEVNVSRVTFFNYFPSKEHALDFIVVVWMFEIVSALERNGLTGVAAIEHVFGMVGDRMAERPTTMRRFIGHFGSRPASRSLPVLGRAERAALAPDLAGREFFTPMLGDLLMRLVDEARRDAELNLEGSTYEVAHFLGALINGAMLIGHSRPKTDWAQLFRRHAARALGRSRSGRASAMRAGATRRKKKGALR